MWPKPFRQVVLGEEEALHMSPLGGVGQERVGGQLLPSVLGVHASAEEVP